MVRRNNKMIMQFKECEKLEGEIKKSLGGIGWKV